MKKMFKTHSYSYKARVLVTSYMKAIDDGYYTFEDALQFKNCYIHKKLVKIRMAKRFGRIMRQRGVQI